MTASQVRVIKIGGSLLDWPELPIRFRRWLVAQPPAGNVIVVGGGPIVEGLRTVDRAHRLSIESSHWLAIRAMSLTARIAAELLPESRLIDSLEQVDRVLGGPPQLLDIEPFLRAEQGSADALPSGWDVTSDSIAAHLVQKLGASELVLLKSAPAPAGATIQSLVEAGYVDAYFPRAARGLAVRCVDFRSESFLEVVAR